MTPKKPIRSDAGHPRYVTRKEYSGQVENLSALLRLEHEARTDLFARANARIEALEQHHVELQTRLETALQTLRPAPTVYAAGPPETRPAETPLPNPSLASLQTIREVPTVLPPGTHGGSCTCPVCAPALWAAGIKGAQQNGVPAQTLTTSGTPGTWTSLTLTRQDGRTIIKLR